MTAPLAPLWTLLTSREEFGGDLPLLTVVSEYGVRLRDLAEGRAPSEDLGGYRVVRAGDLVVNRLWARFGAYGVAEIDGLISPAYWVMRVSPAVDPRFLHSLLRSAPYRAEIWRRSRDMPPNGFDLPWEQFRKIEIPVPAINAQRAIADYLDAETARIDAMIDRLRRVADLLDERRVATIATALEPQPHEEPVRLKFRVGRPTSGNRDHSFTEDETGVPCLRGLNIKAGRIDRQNLMRISEADHRSHKATELRAGDVVVVRSGNAGIAAVVPEDLNGSNCVDLVILRRAAGIWPRYLEYALNSHQARSQATEGIFGATLTHFNAVDIAELRLRLPPLAVQQAQADELDQVTGKIDRLRGVLASQIRLLLERRQAVITSAVTGGRLAIPGTAA